MPGVKHDQAMKSGFMLRSADLTRCGCIYGIYCDARRLAALASGVRGFGSCKLELVWYKSWLGLKKFAENSDELLNRPFNIPMILVSQTETVCIGLSIARN